MIKSKKKKYNCETQNCNNKIIVGKKCSSCRCFETRKKDPEKYAYNNLKSNAKKRNIVFELTIEEFCQFCIETNYIIGKGKTKLSLTIDRKNNDIGYILSNLRVLTNSENSSKGTKKLEYDCERAKFTVTKTIDPEITSDNPF